MYFILQSRAQLTAHTKVLFSSLRDDVTFGGLLDLPDLTSWFNSYGNHYGVTRVWLRMRLFAASRRILWDYWPHPRSEGCVYLYLAADS